jgi:ABC-type multidrug transport system fused ATPase/permease subunit
MLILDEATNSLDSENEGRVPDASESRRGELTVVLIAHRLSTIRWADLIYVVEGGRSSQATGRRLARCATAGSEHSGKRRA